MEWFSVRRIAESRRIWSTIFGVNIDHVSSYEKNFSFQSNKFKRSFPVSQLNLRLAIALMEKFNWHRFRHSAIIHEGYFFCRYRILFRLLSSIYSFLYTDLAEVFSMLVQKVNSPFWKMSVVRWASVLSLKRDSLSEKWAKLWSWLFYLPQIRIDRHFARRKLTMKIRLMPDSKAMLMIKKAAEWWKEQKQMSLSLLHRHKNSFSWVGLLRQRWQTDSEQQY